MSQINVKTDGVKNLSGSLGKLTSNLMTDRMEVASIRYSIDPRILSRRNIGARINNACNSINALEAKLQGVGTFMGSSMDRYWTAENRVNQLAAQMLGKSDAHSGSDESSKPWYERLFDDGVAEIKHIEKKASDEWNSFTNEFNQVKNEMKDFLVNTGDSIASEIKNHGMDDLKAVGNFLWEASGAEAEWEIAKSGIKVVSDFMAEHPRLAAGLTIAGGVLIMIGTAGTAAPMLPLIFGGLVVAFGMSDLKEADHIVNKTEEERAEGKDVKVSEVAAEDLKEAENNINEDYNPGRKLLRSISSFALNGIVGKDEADKIGWYGYGGADLATAAISIVVDPGEAATALSKVNNVVSVGEKVTSSMSESSKITNLLGDINIISGFKSMPNLVDKAGEIKVAIDNLVAPFNEIKTPIVGAINKTTDVIKYTAENGALKDIPGIINYSKDYIIDAAKYGVNNSGLLQYIGDIKGSSIGFMKTLGTSYKPASLINDIGGINNSYFKDNIIFGKAD